MAARRLRRHREDAGPGRYREITDRIRLGNRLEELARHVDAMETFLVAADLAEEVQDDRARRLRGRARRVAVFLAARERWPGTMIELGQVTGPEPPRGEITTFQILSLDRREVVRVVRIDRRGRLRVIEGRRT